MKETKRLNLLENVLRSAAQTPGNYDRFHAAGLLNSSSRPSGELCAEWHSRFERLAVLRKGELRSRPGAFLSNASDIVYRGKTSGTTADAFTYFAGKAWNEERVKARQRNQAWWGLDSTLCGDAPVVNVASRLGPVGLQDSSLIGPVDYGFLESLLQIVGAGPVVLRGYPSRLCEVAIALRRNQLTLPVGSVKAVIATGERLFEMQRSLIEDTFRVPIINEYGCQESGISGISCPEAGRIHLDEDRCLYEVIEGELVTTDLWNTTMPMVRYVSGDEIAPYADPCPCGRPGLTAKMLGREHQRALEKVELPAFRDILSYRITVEGSQRRILVQPEKVPTEETLQPLKAWFERTFGIGNTEVLVESPFNEGSGVEALSTLTCESWLEQVTQLAWSTWITQPPPTGEAASAVVLLQQMVIPNQVVGRGISQKVLRLMHEVQDSRMTADMALEAMKLRVLLWALSLMTEEEEPEAIANSYSGIMKRFDDWRSRCSDRSKFSPLGFDMLAPLLTMGNGAARWKQTLQMISECWPDGMWRDRFTVHHYLTVLDIAGQNAQRRGHVWTPLLRPLSALLVGDFSRMVSSLSVQTIALWMEIVHEREVEIEKDETTFESVWRAFRRSLLKKDKPNAFKHLDALFGYAETDQQIAQCWLEKSYTALIFEEEIDPQEWLAVLKEQVGVLNPLGKTVSNPMAWSPFLKALAPRLVAIGKHELAYACLFAAAPPNRKISSFDRLSIGVNGKQPAISITS